MPKIAVSGGELYYEEFGSGDEIIVSAQMDFTGRPYPKLLAEAPSRYRVLEFWLRGYGRSTPVTTDRLRLRITRSPVAPAIAEFALLLEQR